MIDPSIYIAKLTGCAANSIYIYTAMMKVNIDAAAQASNTRLTPLRPVGARQSQTLQRLAQPHLIPDQHAPPPAQPERHTIPLKRVERLP